MIERPLWESAVELQQFLEKCQYEFCFIGGIAYQRWGEPHGNRTSTRQFNCRGLAEAREG